MHILIFIFKIKTMGGESRSIVYRALFMFLVKCFSKSVMEVSPRDTFLRFERNFGTCLEAFSRQFMGIRAYFTYRHRKLKKIGIDTF